MLLKHLSGLNVYKVKGSSRLAFCQSMHICFLAADRGAQEQQHSRLETLQTECENDNKPQTLTRDGYRKNNSNLKSFHFSFDV